MEAFRVLRKLPSPIGPQGFRSGVSWIVRDTFADAIAANELRDKKLWDWGNRRPSAREISLMERALDWPAKYLPKDQIARHALIAWAFAKASGRTARWCARKYRISQTMFDRQRMGAAMIIAQGLARDNVPVD